MVRISYIEPLGISGGMGHYNEALIGAYSTAGHVVSYVTSSTVPGFSTPVRVRTSRFFRGALNRSQPRLVRAAAYIAAQVAGLAYATADTSEVVVMHFLHWPSVDYMALLLHHLMRRRIVLVAHDPFPMGNRKATRAYLRAHRLADVVVVHGPTAREDVMRLGVRAARIVVAPFGDYRSVVAMDRSEAARQLGLDRPPAAPVAVIVGNLKPGKGIARAVSALSHESSPVRSLLVAGTKQGTWNLERALKIPPASQLDVIRHDRRMSDEEELAAYSIGDVVLALYESGYSSAVIARAHAVGRPVVLTDVGDLKSQRAPQDVVVPADYLPEDLRAAIVRALGARMRPPERASDRWRSHVEAVMSLLRNPHR